MPKQSRTIRFVLSRSCIEGTRYQNGGMLKPGTPLPRFTAPDDHGNTVDSSDWHGKWTVLWWYVKADTPG